MNSSINPKNKETFRKLIPFAKNLLSICKRNKINLILYGSFAHFYHTQNRALKVKDIDFYIKEGDFKRLMGVLKKESIQFTYSPEWHTLSIQEGSSKIEIDSINFWYRDIKNKPLKRSFQSIDFYGIKTKILSLWALEKLYLAAYQRSRNNKKKIAKKIRLLEEFLGRKLV